MRGARRRIRGTGGQRGPIDGAGGTSVLVLVGGMIERAFDFVCFLAIALRAYRGARSGNGSHYAAQTRGGVPRIAVFVGVGREAWRISQRVAEEFSVREV